MTPPQTYHRKPVQVEAMRYLPDASNRDAVRAFVGADVPLRAGYWYVLEGCFLDRLTDADFVSRYTPTPALPEERVVEAVKALRECREIVLQPHFTDDDVRNGVERVADAALAQFPEVTDE